MFTAYSPESVAMDHQHTAESALSSRKIITLTSPFVLLSFEWDYVQIAVTEFATPGKVGTESVSFQIDVYDTTQGFSFIRPWSDFHWLNYKLRQYQSVNKLTLPILSESSRNQLTKNLFFLKTNAEKVEKYFRKILAEPFLRCTPELFDFMAAKGTTAAANGGVQGSTKASRATTAMADHGLVAKPNQQRVGALGLSPKPTTMATGAAPAPRAKKDVLKINTQDLGAPFNVNFTAQPRTKKMDKGAIANFTVLENQTGTNDQVPRISSMTSSARLENFDLLKVVGRGCMGKVFLARDKMTDELVAIKSISKEKVLRQNEVEHILGERDILANIADNNHPYLMKLRYSFQTEGHLFLVLDYLPGGDIATQLARYYRFSEERSRFYAAEILLGLEELHRMGIVYRDLKPENMLIDRHGHILLTDFGLSKQLPTEGYDNLGCPRYRRRTKTFCGTAEYLAPEMLRGEIYDQGIDFWSLGTCLYEMMTGMTPFWAENHSKMYQRVLFDRLHFPANMSWEARSLITGLLAKDPQKRLGAGEFGVEQVKSHPFFASVNWSSFMERRVTAPVVPPVAHAEDVSNFEDAFINLPVELAATNRDYLQEYYATHGCLGSNGVLATNPFERYDYVSRFVLPKSQSQHIHPQSPARAMGFVRGLSPHANTHAKATVTATMATAPQQLVGQVSLEGTFGRASAKAGGPMKSAAVSDLDLGSFLPATAVSPVRSQQPTPTYPQSNLFHNVNMGTLEQLQKLQRAAPIDHHKVFRPTDGPITKKPPMIERTN